MFTRGSVMSLFLVVLCLVSSSRPLFLDSFGFRYDTQTSRCRDCAQPLVSEIGKLEAVAVDIRPDATPPIGKIKQIAIASRYVT